MDQNWLMAALQSPEGMNFLNSWRQRYGGGPAAGVNPGSQLPGTGGMHQGTFPNAGTIPGTGGMNPGPYRGRMPGTGGMNPGTYTGNTPTVSFSVPSASTPSIPTVGPTSFRGGLMGGANDLSGQQQSAASPMMPFWNPGN